MQRARDPNQRSSPPSERHGGETPRYRVHPDDEADVRAAIEDIAAGRTVELSEDELAEWERTGTLPASVEARFAALECDESRD